ncbi:MAG: hypothetical protein GQ538_06800 [Xanthomonadales bacterium]|nr:hypothetical protein [Xanthomonadales bacterium]
MRKDKRGIWVASLVISFMLIILQTGLQQHYGKIDDANRINTLFYTVLPAHPHPDQLAIKLGIQSCCAEMTNTSWYLKRGRDHRLECPGAFDLSRMKLVAVLASEPATMIRLILRALHQSGAWRLPYVGEVAGGDLQKQVGLRGLSISSLVALLPFSAYVLFYILPLWAGLWAGLWLLKHSGSENFGLQSLMLAQTLLSLMIIIVSMTALFGDGFSEFSRHVHLAHNACAVSWLILLALIVLVFKQSGDSRVATRSVMPYIASTGAVLLLVLIPFAVSRMALGFGVMDKPAYETYEGNTLDVSGWAVDPSGVASVYAVVDGTERWSLSQTPDSELKQFFPVGQTPVVFHGSVPLDASRPETVVQILITSKSGQVSVIDRRWMRREN